MKNLANHWFGFIGALALATLLAAGAFSLGGFAVAQGTDIDYDSDNDGLIEVGSLAQLDAIRWDMDADGAADNTDDSASYAAAFPNAVTGMGCPSAGCEGYELTTDLDFDTNANGQADAGDDYWNGGAGWDPIGGEVPGQVQRQRQHHRQPVHRRNPPGR